MNDHTYSYVLDIKEIGVTDAGFVIMGVYTGFTEIGLTSPVVGWIVTGSVVDWVDTVLG